MNKINCLITTKEHREFAQKLGLNPTVVTNLAALHLTLNPTSLTFTEADAKNLLSLRKEALAEAYTAVPIYTDMGEEAKDRLAGTDTKTGEIKLWRLPSDNPMGFFSDYIQGKKDDSVPSLQKKLVFDMLIKQGQIESIDALMKLLDNPTDVYRFLLWHEMSHRQNNDPAVYWANGKDLLTSDKLNIEYRATADALGKMRAWRKDHPVKKVDNLQRSPMLETTNIVESFAGFNNNHIQFIGSTHTYLVDGKAVDTSVTLWVHRDNPTEEEKDPTVAGFLEVASELGTIHDELSRVFFDKSAEKRDTYPNMSSEDIEGFTKQLELLKAELDKQFPKGYKVYTNEDYLRVAGVIQTKEGPKTIAGTMDMLIVDNEGNLHIYDFKTHRANNGVLFHKDTLDGYYSQIALYLALLEANYPELKGKIKTHKLVLYNISYNTPRGSRANETGTTDYIIKNGQVYIKNAQGLSVSILAHTQEVEGEVRRTYSSGQFMGLVPVQTKTTEPVMGIRISPSRQDLSTPSQDTSIMPSVGVDNNRVTIDRDNPIIKINQAFTPSQRRDRVNFIARLFSDEVTGAYEEALAKAEEDLEKAIQDNDQEAYTKASADIQELNDPVKGRQLAIKKRTVETIVDNIRQAFIDMRDYASDDYTRGQYLNVLDNFEYLLDQATFVIELNEHMKLSLDTHAKYNGSYESLVLGGTVETLPLESLEGREEDDDDEDGSRATGNDGWSFKVRFVDPHSSLSKTTKRILSNLVNLNQVTGEPELDDLGNEKYINELHAHTVLLDALSYMIDDSDFCIKEEDEEGNISYTFPALEKLVNKYKWVQQVIDELTNNPSEVSAFYADFRKDFIPYWMSKEVTETIDGKEVTTVRSIPLNQSTGYESAKNTLLYNLEQGIAIDEDSVYSAKGLRPESITKGKELLSSIDMQEVEEEDMEDVTKAIAKAVRMLGLPMTAGNVVALWQTADGDKDITDVVNTLKRIFDKAELAKDKKNAHLIAEAELDFNILCRLLNEITETDAVGSFRDGDKTRYSYSAPNYINTQFKMLTSEARRQEYLDTEFKPYSWFFNSATGKWRNRWLEQIENDEDVRANMAIKELSNIDNTEYSQWSPGLIRERFITEYFAAGYNPASKKQYAYYNYPIFSDSPVAMFIKFTRYVDDYEGEITRGLREVALQELERIKLVQDRENAGISTIACFDGKRGKSFCFLPFLNNYVTEDGKSFIDKVGELTKVSIDAVNEFIDSVIYDYMNEESAKFLQQQESMALKLVDTKIADNIDDAYNKLREFFWNHHYAESLIIQLTTTDLAFYKDGTDFQKRYKEVYAAGTKLNTQAKYGRTHERTIYLSDQEITSINYTDIKKALQVAVDKGHISKMDMDDILFKFRNITATDAQAYRSISSFRAILDMMGLWTDNMQSAFDRLQNGEWDMADFNIVWQTIKPFVYTQIGKSDGLGGQIKVPHLNKNSEFLLLAMHLLVATSMNKSPKLVALNKFMEDNDIDVAQFESAVKAGKQGCIDISYSESKLLSWIKANDKQWGEILDASSLDEGTDFEFFKDGNDVLLDQGKISQEEYNRRIKALEPSSKEVENILTAFTRTEDGGYNPDTVHEIPYRDYVVAQPTPEHLFDAEAVFGSQFRNLIVSDMPDDPNFRVEVNGKEYTKQEILTLYNSLITENLLDDFEKVKGRYESIEVLLKELMKLVRGNAKYGKNLLDALQLVDYTDPNTGETKKVFNIPIYSPSITALIQELTTSMFKNDVTKQKIKGAACILASNFGFTNELHINYNSDGSIKEAECYLPWYSKKYFKPFLVTKTAVVNGKTVEYQELDITKVPKNLLQAVGYRIPTEDKYSMIPLRVKGFLPQLNGGTIMLPAEITQIAGSDFDVDKLFMMLPASKVDTYDMKRAKRDFETINSDTAVDKLLSAIFATNDEVDVLEQAPDNFKSWFNKHKEDYEYDTPKIRKVTYNPNLEASKQSRDARNNMLIDISRGILLNLDTAEKLLNPGSFDKAKLAARVAQVTANAELVGAYAKARNIDPTNVKAIRESLKKESLKSIDKFLKAFKSERDPLALETFVYNHVQNMTGGMLIGMYANNTTMLAKFQGTGIKLKVIPPTPKFKGLDNTFTIDGHKIEALDAVFSPWGERISKNCAEFSAASVDNVKDPVLADLLQNTNTAGIAGFMLRAGIPVRIIGLMFTQPIVKECVQTYGDLSYKHLSSTIEKWLRGSNIGNGGRVMTSDRLLDNIIEAATTNVDDLSKEEYEKLVDNWVSAAQLMLHIQGCASDMSAITRVSRADSPNGAIGITLGKARNQVLAVTRLIASSKSNKYRISGLSKAMMANHKVSISATKDLARIALMNAKMTRLQAFYSLGIELPLKVMAPFFVQLNERLDDLLSRMYIQAPYGSLKDEMVEAFYKEYIEYMLTESPLFGNDGTQTFDQKRDYYLYEFPAKFYSAKNNPKFKDYTVLSKIGVREGVIQLFRSGRLTPAIRENFTTDFDSMIASEDPEVQQMAIDLFMYSFYKDGYLFGPNAFGLFFSPFFLTSFTEFMDSLRGIEDKVKTMDFTRFISQFYNNHWLEITFEPRESLVMPIVKTDMQDPDSDIIVPKKLVMNEQTAENRLPYQYILYEGSFYKLRYGSDTACTYAKVPTVTDEQGKKYNAAEDVIDMIAHLTNKDLISKNKTIGAKRVNFEELMARMEEMFALMDAMEAAMADMDAQFEAMENQGYNIEDSLAQLDKPLC